MRSFEDERKVPESPECAGLVHLSFRSKEQPAPKLTQIEWAIRKTWLTQTKTSPAFVQARRHSLFVVLVIPKDRYRIDETVLFPKPDAQFIV